MNEKRFFIVCPQSAVTVFDQHATHAAAQDAALAACADDRQTHLIIEAIAKVEPGEPVVTGLLLKGDDYD